MNTFKKLISLFLLILLIYPGLYSVNASGGITEPRIDTYSFSNENDTNYF